MKTRFLLLSLVLFFLLCGCNSVPYFTPTVSTSEMNSSSQTVITLTPTPESLETTRTATATLTAIPTRTLSPTNTPTPTLPAFPTLTFDESYRKLLELNRTNAGCNLPCWWGFTPGETYWTDANHFLAQFRSIIFGPFSNYRPAFPEFFYAVLIPLNPSAKMREEFIIGANPSSKTREEYFIQNYLVDKKGIIQEISIYQDRRVDFRDYSLSAILRTYGKPSEILIRTQAVTPLPRPFTLDIYFSDQGIWFSYVGEGVQTNEHIRSCFGSNQLGAIALVQPGVYDTLQSVANFMDKNIDLYSEYRPIQDVTDMSIGDFYQKYKDIDTPPCIFTPASLW